MSLTQIIQRNNVRNKVVAQPVYCQSKGLLGVPQMAAAMCPKEAIKFTGAAAKPTARQTLGGGSPVLPFYTLQK